MASCTKSTLDATAVSIPSRFFAKASFVGSLVLFALGVALPAFAASTSAQGNNAPIEITSDQLEVDQNANIAIFTGKVVAVQADMQLTSDRMKVFYKDSGAAASEQATGQQQSISKIEVEGNVFMTTPAETARGLTGVYNAEKDELTLNGDVVLTKDKNVLKGASLVYNMGTGKSVLKNAGGAAVTGGKTDRVRALFVPGDKKGQTKP